MLRSDPAGHSSVKTLCAFSHGAEGRGRGRGRGPGGGSSAPRASRHHDASSARATLSDPPDTATPILWDGETPRSLRAKVKRFSKPRLLRLKPADGMHMADRASEQSCGFDGTCSQGRVCVLLHARTCCTCRMHCQTSLTLHAVLLHPAVQLNAQQTKGAKRCVARTQSRHACMHARFRCCCRRGGNLEVPRRCARRD